MVREVIAGLVLSGMNGTGGTPVLSLHWDGSGSTHPSPQRAPANFTLGLHLYQLTEAALP